MADGNHYLYQQLAAARARQEEYRKKAEAHAAEKGTSARIKRDPLLRALHFGEAVGTGVLISKISGAAGPEGRTFFNVPVELLASGVLGAAALFLLSRDDGPAGQGPSAGEKAADHLIAMGTGAFVAYTSRQVFLSSVTNAKPPEESQANQVSGAPPPTAICYLPAPPQWMLPATTTAPAMLPATSPAPAVTAVGAPEVYVEPMAPQEDTSIGADDLASAVEILDRMNQR